MNILVENQIIQYRDSCSKLILMLVCLEEPQILKDVRLQTCVEVTQVEKTVTVHAAVQDVVGEQGRSRSDRCTHT